ncbi:hypothetical protein [Vibrio methylphosphonaticus]|nr:hypothetical protein [Vibrio methylphosphonaticus]
MGKKKPVKILKMTVKRLQRLGGFATMLAADFIQQGINLKFA